MLHAWRVRVGHSFTLGSLSTFIVGLEPSNWFCPVPFVRSPIMRRSSLLACPCGLHVFAHTSHLCRCVHVAVIPSGSGLLCGVGFRPPFLGTVHSLHVRRFPHLCAPPRFVAGALHRCASGWAPPVAVSGPRFVRRQLSQVLLPVWWSAPLESIALPPLSLVGSGGVDRR